MEKLLLVEDEAKLRQLVRATIEDERIALVEATDGRIAIDLIRTERPRMVLLDVALPGQSGIDVCRAIKTDPQLKATVVVMLTGSHDPGIRRDSLKAGADVFLTKPFSPVQLLQLTDRVFMAQ